MYAVYTYFELIIFGHSVELIIFEHSVELIGHDCLFIFGHSVELIGHVKKSCSIIN